MADQSPKSHTDTLDINALLKTLVAIKKGDFSVRMPIDKTGIAGKVADTLNDIIELNEKMAKEFDRISTVVGKEGKISQRATIGATDGSWTDTVESINSLITDLVQPTSETARVIRAVARGDLSQTIALEIESRPLKGEFLQTAKIVNTMVDQLNSFASEVTRVAREVGTEGKLGGQAKVKGVAGTWKDLTDNVNLMAGNLTGQVRNIAEVTTAVANGDLSKKITADVQGEMLDLKVTINTMVDQLNSFAAEVTRVAREVGTEGKLGGQADVRGVGGVWKDLTDNVNFMAGNLTGQVRNIAEVTTAVANGDLSKKITVDVRGEMLDLKVTINTMVDQLNSFAAEVTRVAREVGTDGKLGGQADVRGVGGVWKDLTDNVNQMAGNLTGQVRNIAEVATAIAGGDLSKKITADVQGEMLDLKATINTMVDQLNSFAAEVTRVAREVGTEGKLGGQADVKGVAGTWKDLTDNVNYMAGNLTGQVRNIAEVTTAVANGDLSKKITVDVKGEMLDLKATINTMVDQLNSFASEVTRVAREVGTDGKLGGQADVRGVGGVWKDLTDNVNQMAGNLTGQVRNIAEVTTAVANGDLSKKITVDVHGEMLDMKNTINTMVDQLNSFSAEVTRVAREVGTDGKLGGQAQVKDVAGVWKDLTDNVNFMAGNLTGQVRNIAEVTTAVANGDLSKKITVDVRGEMLDLKVTINTMVDQLNSFAAEVTRVAREVGTEGKLGGQADVRGVGGVWKDLTDNVNSMAGNLTGQVRGIATVVTAVANGDLKQKLALQAKGEIAALADTINQMIDQLNSFAAEVTRVAREVGTEGKLGGQADVRGVGGVWKDLTDNVNLMAGNLTGQVRNIAEVTTAVANGDLSKKITVDVRGEMLDMKNTINTMVDQLNSFAAEVTRVAREVGTEGKLGGQAQVRGVGGVWKDLTDNVNSMAGNLTGQVRNIAEVTTAVANGNLSRKITVDVRGEMLDMKNTINTMVDQLNSFAAEVTRVAREVGTEGKLGGQAEVRGVGGVWKDLTDNVNSMAGNLTQQVRGIATVVTAVANGDLKQKLALQAKGEIATLADTINQMIDTLATFADQVTTVAREVGIEGKLGGQASVPGASGTWRHLTDNVNQLAANLTTQVRAIAEVATAVTKGDLSRSIKVSAQGELAELQDNINQMIANLRETTQKNTEQDWLKTNLAKFTRMLQGQRELETVSKQILFELAPLVGAQHGVFYLMDNDSSYPLLKLVSSYAYKERKSLSNQFRLGEGLVGQCALEKERILVREIPSDYVRISSGLGDASPSSLVVLPILFEGQVSAVIELASFYNFSEIHLTFLDQLTESIGIVLNTIDANMRTEKLLNQSQSLATELQNQQTELTETNRRLEQQARSLQASEDLLRNQQEELQKTNEELEEKARLLAIQNQEVERKNREIEQAKQALEEKAEQLALSSRYKSEFLANMSHELRTPLNSMLILSRLLSDNADGNLTSKQVEFARTIHLSGADLLALINDILDLAKIESGNMSPEIVEVLMRNLADDVERAFRQIAFDRGIGFYIDLDPDLPETLFTDPRRLQQILRNLLSNAFKFTERGEVRLKIENTSNSERVFDNDALRSQNKVIAFSVIDTGIGIPYEKQRIIFEAFQQADGTTSRKYGGTGLGLSISREIAQVLGGEIHVTSTLGAGSTFTLYLPRYAPSPLPPNNRVKTVTTTLPIVSSTFGLSPRDLLPQDQLPSLLQNAIKDDRDDLRPEDRVLLIIEDDVTFAQILQDIVREHGFKVIVTLRGDEGLELAKQYKPHAITLDMMMPEVDGWTVLDRLKHDPELQHIPVHIISVTEDSQSSLELGALAHLKKPVTKEKLHEAMNKINNFINRPIKSLLLVEDNMKQRQNMVEIVGEKDVNITAVGTATQALEALKQATFDAIALDFDLPDMNGLELIEQIEEQMGDWKYPIILYTSKTLTPKQQEQLRQISKRITIKNVKTLEGVLNETTLFLHRIQRDLPPEKRQMIGRVNQASLSGHRILIVDDDIRNIFALTSILERNKIEALYAENGQDGIQKLINTSDIDVVLMDIMMPEMDGYEAIRRIRSLPQFNDLPIIALTAKAMKGDREKCLEAGATDYITKPVDVDQLLSLIRVLLFKRSVSMK
jgi:HAMP domain-containing protein/CheY-like chemotaxis protein/signal transduction histidine kinase